MFSNATKHKKVRRKKEEEYLRKIRKDVILKLKTTCFLEISTFIPYATLEHRNKKKKTLLTKEICIKSLMLSVDFILFLCI